MSKLRQLFARKWVRACLLAVVLPLPLWILICNVALWVGGVEALVTRDSAITSVRLAHGRAWMLWPTVVHVRDAHLEIDTYSYQLKVEVDEAEVEMRLLSLFDHRVQFEHIRASGAMVEYRAKVDPEEGDDPDLLAYAPFDGTPPQVQSTEPKPVPSAEDAWGVDLDDLDVAVDRMWIDEFDVEPCGFVRGGMHWTDGGDLWTPASVVQLVDAGLWIGEHEALRGLTGTAQLEVAPFDTSEITQPAGYLDFGIVAEGELIDILALAAWWPEVDGRLSSAPGPIEIAAAADDGVLLPGTRIHHQSERGSFAAERVRVTAAPELVLDLDDGGHGRARVWLRGAALHGRPGGELAHGDEVTGELLTKHADMTKAWDLERVHIETGELVADDLRRISAAVGSSSVALNRGRAQGHAIADMGPDGIPHGTYELALEDAVLEAGDFEVGAALHSSGRVQRNADGEIVAEELTLRSKGITVKSPSGVSKGTWVRLKHGSVHYKDERVTVETRGAIEDARPAIVHATHLDGFLDAVPDLQRQVPIEAHVRVSSKAGVLDVEILDTEQLGLHVAGLFRKQGEHWRVALLASGLTALGFTASDEHEMPRPAVLVGKQWLVEQRGWVRGAHDGKGSTRGGKRPPLGRKRPAID